MIWTKNAVYQRQGCIIKVQKRKVANAQEAKLTEKDKEIKLQGSTNTYDQWTHRLIPPYWFYFLYFIYKDSIDDLTPDSRKESLTSEMYELPTDYVVMHPGFKHALITLLRDIKEISEADDCTSFESRAVVWHKACKHIDEHIWL